MHVAFLLNGDPVRVAGEPPLILGIPVFLALSNGLVRRSFRRAGLIGAATKWARLRSRLTALGHSSNAIARIACPIGDPTLCSAPQQIVIGVASKLLADSPPCAATKPYRQETV